MTKISAVNVFRVLVLSTVLSSSFNITTGQHKAIVAVPSVFAYEGKHATPIEYNAIKNRSLAKVLADVGMGNTTLFISNEIIVQESVNVPANVTLKFQNGGMIKVAPNNILTIKGQIIGDLSQIFSGLGKVRIQSDRLKSVHPEWWGAKRDGQSDDTMPIQATIDSISTKGGKVLFDRGTYIVNSITIPSNVSISGNGRESVLQQKRNTNYCISINPTDGGTPNLKENKYNIKIQNIHFRGTVEFEGFSEHSYLLNINAATGVTISKCWFTGWRGDGIYIGSSNVAKTERHNKNISIKDCEFDGLNNDNRNAITVIDCNGLTIDSNSFVNCTRDNMPGAIDIEPNDNNFSIIDNINISRNKFRNIGGNVGIIAVVLNTKQNNLNSPIRNIEIDSNSINGQHGKQRSNGVQLLQKQSAEASDMANNIVLSNNEINSTFRPFSILGVKDVSVENNILNDSTRSGLVSYKDYKARDIVFKNNSFSNIGIIDGSCVTVNPSSGISFIGNIFSCNMALSGNCSVAINLLAENYNNVEINNNKFVGNKMAHAIKIKSKRLNASKIQTYTKNNSFDKNIEPITFL